jgi:tetratricopeptide (TPR) repeat protein
MNGCLRNLAALPPALLLLALLHVAPSAVTNALAQGAAAPPSALSAGDAAAALKSMESLAASEGVTPAERNRMIETIVATHFKNQNFTRAAEWGQRYVKAGGTDAQTRAMAARSLYQIEEFAGAANVLRADIESDEKAGRAPSQDRIQMLASCYVKLGDNAGYVYALEKMLAYYPRKEYWADAIRRVETTPGFAADRLTLDLARLMQATGNLTTAPQYTVMIQRALEAGLPAEAKRVADQGFAAGVLGTGADAAQHRKLQETAAKQAADDERTLAQSVKDAGAAKDGNPSVNVGFALVSAGQYERGIALMEQGLQKGGVRRPDDAKLHLGIAYLRAGQNVKANATFRTVEGTDGTAALARLWAIHAQRPAG